MPKFSIDKALQAISERFTPEQREEQRVRSRELVGRIDPNSPPARRARLRRLEKSVRKQIAFLTSFPDSELKEARLTNAFAELAGLRADQGDYAEAVTYATDDTHREEYQLIKAALERSGETVCDCPVETVRTDKGMVRISPRYKMLSILTPDGERSLIRCGKCGAMLAK